MRGRKEGRKAGTCFTVRQEIRRSHERKATEPADERRKENTKSSAAGAHKRTRPSSNISGRVRALRAYISGVPRNRSGSSLSSRDESFTHAARNGWGSRLKKRLLTNQRSHGVRNHAPTGIRHRKIQQRSPACLSRQRRADGERDHAHLIMQARRSTRSIHVRAGPPTLQELLVCVGCLELSPFVSALQT